MFCRSFFVLLYFFFWPLCFLFFFDIQILITPLVSSNSYYVIVAYTFLTSTWFHLGFFLVESVLRIFLAFCDVLWGFFWGGGYVTSVSCVQCSLVCPFKNAPSFLSISVECIFGRLCTYKHH